MVVWRVGADEGVGEGDAVADHDDVGEVFEVHLVDDADAGGTTRKLSKACWPHLRNS